ncbi:MAG TPA: ABC transporter substrate-binding protein [Noviherbaspirillum sp.]|nr:ABC transporter substrate-binding protein [Noviherbaspirillum sp.]
MMKSMQKLINTLSLVFLAPLLFMLGVSSAAAAATPMEAPDVLVKRVTREVMEAATSDKAIQGGDRRRIQQVVEEKILPHLDFERTTALTVGRHWRATTPEQRQRLIGEYRALLMHTYAGAMSQINDQKLEYKPLRMNPDDTETEVRFQVRQPRRDEPVQVSYRMVKTPDGWKIYDVNVLGVWLIETYKASFSDIINRDGVDGLIDTLTEKNRSLARANTGAGKHS